MTDYLYRGIINALDIRFVLIDCQQTAQDIILRHNCDPVSAHAAARAAGSAALLSALLVEDEKYTIRWNYNGKLTTVIADCDAEAHVRVLITPTDLASQVSKAEDVCGTDGTVTLIKSSSTKTLNSGSTAAGLLDIVEDIAFYFSTSDQIETAMAVVPVFRPDPQAPVKSCRGIMLQALPDCDLERFGRIRERLAKPECRKILSDALIQDNAFERIAMLLCQDEAEDHAFTLEGTATPSFKCNCSKERMIAALGTLNPGEAEEMLREKGSIAITCRFCNTRHVITADDLKSAK